MRKFLLSLVLATSALQAEEELSSLSYLLDNGIVTEYHLNGSWSLFDGNTTYYNLDNETIADYDSVVDDPFLVIRTKCGDPNTAYSITDSWYNYTRFSPFEAIPVEGETFTYPEKLMRPPHRSSEPPSVVFDHRPVSFELPHSEKGAPLHWQISPVSDFSLIIPNLEGVQTADSPVVLDPISETFFNPGVTYFFRYQTSDNASEETWSDPISFSVLRPGRVANVTFEKIDHDRFELSWNAKEKNVRYWIFASNALDFIPSVYGAVQINAATPGTILAEEPNNNHIATTTDPRIIVDGSYAYYRIIAERDGAFSVPSDLIHIYDEGMIHQRTVLQRTPSPVLGFAQRILFPADREFDINEPNPTPAANKKPAVVHDSVWQRVKPYLMPLNHPIRAKLDRLFSSKRVLLNSDTLSQAGFKKATPGPFSKAVVSEHSKMKGYFFKMFMDSQHNLIDWEQWVRRCYGAASCRASIHQLNLRSHFAVPHKWIYPLPARPVPPPQYSQKFFICVAEKIPIYKRDKNYKKWRKMSRQRLEAIVILLQREGLTDSIRAFNLPFSKDGRNALIDLEHNHHWPVHFDAMKRWLSSSNRIYLDQLKAKHVH